MKTGQKFYFQYYVYTLFDCLKVETNFQFSHVSPQPAIMHDLLSYRSFLLGKQITLVSLAFRFALLESRSKAISFFIVPVLSRSSTV